MRKQRSIVDNVKEKLISQRTASSISIENAQKAKVQHMEITSENEAKELEEQQYQQRTRLTKKYNYIKSNYEQNRLLPLTSQRELQNYIEMKDYDKKTLLKREKNYF